MDEKHRHRVLSFLKDESISRFLSDDSVSKLFSLSFRVLKVLRVGEGKGSRAIVLLDWQEHIPGKTHHATIWADEALLGALLQRGFFSQQCVAVSVFLDEEEAAGVKEKIASLPRASVGAMIFA